MQNDGPEKTTLQLRLPVALKRRLKTEAARTGSDMSEIARETLQRELDERGTPAPQPQAA